MNPTRDQELRQEDQEARELARTVFETPIILEAGAGTGKTTTLIARILTWCLADGWERNRAALDDDADAEDIAGRVLDRVAAITFTEKAAAEMSARFAEALGLILRDEPVNGFPERQVVEDQGERVRRARALLTNVHRLQIVTIHAFSARLLRSHPIEAGLHPSFKVDAEGMALRGMIEKVLAEHLPGAYGQPGNPDLLALAELGIGPERLATMLEVLAREPRSSGLLEEDPLHPDRVRKTLSRLGAAMAPLLEALEVAFDAPPKSTTAKAVSLKETLRELGDSLLTVESAADLVGAVTQFVESGDGLERLKKWAGPGPTKTEQKLLGDAVDIAIATSKAIAPQIAHLSKVNPAVLEHARAALEPLQVEVRRRMHHAGIETFSGLLADSKRLLEEHPQVAATERRNLDQLLVDEFQDTDPTQYALVGMLALEGDEAERPGFFLVGDPKQSIYGWRQADLGEYDRFVEKVVARGGKQLSLCVNFRSVPAILDEVERCISPIMHREIGIQPAFQRLLPSGRNIDESGFLAGKRSPVEYWNSWIRTDSGTTKRLEKTGARAARIVEARAVARDLRNLHDHHDVKWNAFGLLMRNTSGQEIYLDALRSAGVPFLVERDQSWFRRREVIDAAATVRAIVDPNDHLALLTFLRSPAVGVPDAALIPLWGGDLPQLATQLSAEGTGSASSRDDPVLKRIDSCIDDAVAALPGNMPELKRIAGWDATMRYGLRSLAILRDSFRHDAADLFVEKLRAILLSEDTEASRFLGTFRLANLDRFFRRLLTALTEGEGGPHALLRELRQGTEQGLEAEEGTPGDETLDAVRVLTIHKAKGLSFDQVYLVDLHHGPPGKGFSRDTLDIGRNELQGEFRLLGHATLDFDLEEEHVQRIGAAESVRALYVATTRPRHRLVLVGRWPKDTFGTGQEPPPPEAAQSAIHLLQGRDHGIPDFAALDQETKPDEPAALTAEDGVIWRLPDHESSDDVDGSSPRREDPEDPLTATEARRHLQLLTTDRCQARSRMDRTLTGTASNAAHHGAAAPAVGPHDPLLSRALGTAVHAVFENLDASGDVDQEMERQKELLPHYLRPLVKERHLEDAIRAAEAILEHLRAGTLLERFWTISPQIVSRELPFLLDAAAAAASEAGHRPLDAVIGTIDLLYRDPETDSLVVADFKTDQIEGSESIQARSDQYAPQGRLYVDAVHHAFPDEPIPRFELWFLHCDEVISLS